MSAFSIGSDTATVENRVRSSTADTKAPATIVKWIPGEAITFYAAILGVGAAQGALTGDETPQQLLERIDAGSFAWFATGALIAAALVALGAFTTTHDEGKRPSLLGLLARIGLTLIAFALWTSALPGSWTYSLIWIRDMGAAYALLLVPLGIVFAAVAEWVTRSIRL
ncbi:hypothetical protein [Micropruina sp.]|uniref:hypothetical protein n=1 Tax=Micropruina sp. TaxID=2737536 RepID=UPI0039E65926